MGRKYTVSFTDVPVSSIQDLFQLEAITVPVVIHAIFLSQNSDEGDANAENLTLKFNRVTDAVPDVASEVKLDQRDSAALAYLSINVETPLTTGLETIHSECWNIAIPFIWMPPPELRITVSPSDAFVLNLPTAPIDSVTMSGVMYFEEIG